MGGKKKAKTNKKCCVVPVEVNVCWQHGIVVLVAVFFSCSCFPYSNPHSFRSAVGWCDSRRCKAGRQFVVLAFSVVAAGLWRPGLAWLGRDWCYWHRAKLSIKVKCHSLLVLCGSHEWIVCCYMCMYVCSYCCCCCWRCVLLNSRSSSWIHFKVYWLFGNFYFFVPHCCLFFYLFYISGSFKF